MCLASMSYRSLGRLIIPGRIEWKGNLLLLLRRGVGFRALSAQKFEIRIKQRNSKTDADEDDLDMRSKQWSGEGEGWVSFKAWTR